MQRPREPSGVLKHLNRESSASEARPSPLLRAPLEFSAPRRRPGAPVSHARTPNWARPARGAHAAGGASRGLCVQTAQWAAAVGGKEGGAWPMGCGLSGLTDRRTHTHSATRAPPGPTRAAQFCAGCIVHRSRSSCPPASSRAPAPRAPAPRAVRAIRTGKGGAPGWHGGPRTPRAPHGAAAEAGNSRPWASGERTRRARVLDRLRPPPGGRRARPDPGVITGPLRPEPSCPGLVLLQAKLGQAPAPPGARPWAGREGLAPCQGQPP